MSWYNNICLYFTILFYEMHPSEVYNAISSIWTSIFRIFKFKRPLINDVLILYFISFFFFLKFFLLGHIDMSFFGATGTPVLDFWWRLLWVSKPEWVLPYSHCRGEYNVHSLRSIFDATHCQPLDRQHCRASTGFISCPRILLCGSSESQTRDQQIMSAAR